jgi:hypothetical protein
MKSSSAGTLEGLGISAEGVGICPIVCGRPRSGGCSPARGWPKAATLKHREREACPMGLGVGIDGGTRPNAAFSPVIPVGLPCGFCTHRWTTGRKIEEAHVYERTHLPPLHSLW